MADIHNLGSEEARGEMNKAMGPLAAVLGACVLAALGALSAAEMPGEILFDNQGYGSKKMGPVRFSHQVHAEDYEVSCKTCHHASKGGEEADPSGAAKQRCSACHKIREKVGEAMRLPNAFHQKCRFCHLEVMGEKGACTDCHEERSGS